MSTTRLNKWGNSQGVIIPKKVCERVGLVVGDTMEVSVNPRTRRIELFMPVEDKPRRK